MFGRDENEIRQFLRQALNDERWIIVGMTAANNVRAIDPDIYIEREVRIITFEPENDTFNGRIRIPFTNPDGRKYTVEQEWSARLDTIHYVKSILPE